MPFTILIGDITKQQTDAIVNAANTELKMGGGVCKAIFNAAGTDKLKAACEKIGSCPTGEAVITPAFDLPNKYIIHTPGPIWQGGGQNEEALLYSSYMNSLHLANEYGCSGIAFPLISSGIYGFPKDKAMKMARLACGDFLDEYEMDIKLILHDKSWLVIPKELREDIDDYLFNQYTHHTGISTSSFNGSRDHTSKQSSAMGNKLSRAHSFDESLWEDSCCFCTSPDDAISKDDALEPTSLKERNLADLLSSMDETFSQMLLRLIDEKGYTDTQIYKRANCDRKLFSKIRTNINYNPSKATAIAFAIALRLNMDETQDFMMKAGYALSLSNKGDLIVRYFIEEGCYDIFEINETLFAFECSTL